ncbi:MAG: hypothetical protein VYA53_08790 [Acidobacteriota bacterium]|nr:hypothetical protein [Acidobacteriota bacterium]
MDKVIHTSKIRIDQLQRPIRHAFIEHFQEPVVFGMHGGVKQFYGVESEEEHPATLDYIIAGVGG